MADASELLDALKSIDPSRLDYDQWVQVGMALNREGLDMSVWVDWSRRDSQRFHEGDFEAKWRGFGDSDDEVTAKTIFKMAYDSGWTSPYKPTGGYEWDDPIVAVSADGGAVIKPITTSTVSAGDVGEDKLPEGAPDSPETEAAEYLRALFKPGETVGYVVERDDSKQDDDGRWRPCKAGNTLPVDTLLSVLDSGDSIDCAFGTPRREAGAWIRINPLDGNGSSDSNVTDFRYALVESDVLTPGKQLALIREMRLPVAAIVTSGGKSVHAIVHVDAADKTQYRERVKALYEYCAASGFPCDEQNRNPSRLSRLPGFQRGDSWQRLVQAGSADGFGSWDEWQTWVAEEASDLPEIESVADRPELPDLAPQLIHGVLRDGQKGMLIGPSKAGKSFALIELAIAVCRGWEWLGHECSKGPVLYVNMEIQSASFKHRLADVYASMKLDHGEEVEDGLLAELSGLDIWCLRGHAAPLDKLVPLLVRRCADRGYRLIIIDPIYKVLTGDENSASDMAAFTNQFDVICTALKCAVFYAHHHAKGEAGRRSALDRASGSGVFARDPDAMLDMSPIDVKPELAGELAYSVEGQSGPETRYGGAYRISYTLREFETPRPNDVIFKWPVHVRTDALRSCKVVGEAGGYTMAKRSGETRAEKSDARWEAINDLVSESVEAQDTGDGVTVEDVWKWIEVYRAKEAEDLGIEKDRLREWSTPSKRAKRFKKFGFEKAAPQGGGAYVLKPVF